MNEIRETLNRVKKDALIDAYLACTEIPLCNFCVYEEVSVLANPCRKCIYCGDCVRKNHCESNNFKLRDDLKDA